MSASIKDQLRVALLGLDSPTKTRQAADEIARGALQGARLNTREALALLEIARTVARDGTVADLGAFLRSGRLPEVVALTPQQMEHVRGGRLALTALRATTPERLLMSLLAHP